MNDLKCKVSGRLLAALLSIALVFSMLPFSMLAHGATDEQSDVFTITITDEVGNPIEGATVRAFNNNLTYEDESGNTVNAPFEYSANTDAKGVASFAEITQIMADYKLESVFVNYTVVMDKYKTVENTTQIDLNNATTLNLAVSMISTSINDVLIEGKTLTFNNQEQELVSVTETEGDIITYELNGAAAVTEKPMAKDAGTYEIKVTVSRTGKENLVKTVTTTILPADITDISIEGKNIVYNEKEQELVTLNGSFEENDVVTWTVNSTDNESKDIPKAVAVGTYTIALTVDRGPNYNKLVTEAVTSNLIEGELDLAGLTVKGLEGVYTVKDGSPVAQPAVTVENKGNYELKYQLDDGDLTVNESAWVDEIPTVTDAGSYIVWVKAVKESYNDKDVSVVPAASAIAPYNVYVAKESQSLAFAESAPSEVTISTSNEYDFSATGENLSRNDIEYSLVDATDSDVATITANGKLTIGKAGIVTVKAFRAGNANYQDAEVYKTVVIKNSSDELIIFDADSENYVLAENGVVSEKAASKVNNNDNGILSYSIDKNNIGIAIDATNGKVTITDVDQLTNAMGRTGSVEVTVTANKTDGELDGVEWVYDEILKEWKTQTINKKVFAADFDTYTIQINYADTSSFDSACKIETADPVSGWYNAEYPATISPIDSAKYTIALDEVKWDAFGESVTITDQGTEEHYVYLKDKTTGQISAAIAVNVKVDTIKPEASKIKIEYAKSAIDEFIEKITLGFYKPSVTVRFTAYDNNSGIDYFTWNYTKETSASEINHPTVINGQTVKAVQDVSDSTKYTAEFTITADEANQYRGYLTVTATDRANNTSDIKEDSGNVFVVDTINPQMSIKYEGKEPYTSEIDSIGNIHYFDGNVQVELTITEANFYEEDIKIDVTKDGQPYEFGQVDWGTRDARDQTVGTFTLSGDGDFVVTVNTTDKSGNPMVSYTSETITVDTKAPEIDSVYDKEAQNITLTINEHNFRASDIEVAVEALDINGATVPVKDIQAYVQNADNWTDNGDSHILVLESGENKILEDAIYKLTINYMDISDNPIIKEEIIEGALIDHTPPEASKIKIDYSKSLLDTVLTVLTLGFYNPEVKVTFTAYDNIAGVDTFTWFYDRQDGASETMLKASTGTLTATRNGDEATATLPLPEKVAEQLRGYISVQATDTYENISDIKTDEKMVIVVDNIGPKMTVQYSPENNKVDTRTYNKGNVEVTLTITEANFFKEDVKVTVSKDGADVESADVQWDDETVDLHTGKFTLSGDGDYVVFIEYKDRSNNLVTDEDGNVISYVDGEEEIHKYKSHIITIDTIDPVIEVTYDDTEVSVVDTIADSIGNERKYYANTKTAKITITEHNFNAEDVVWGIVAKDVSGNELNINELHTKSEWTSKGDEHTMIITYPGDANYTFDMAYTDLAKREAVAPKTDYFTVDKTAPTIKAVNYSTSVLETALESVSFGFYNAKMTVTLIAEDTTSEVHSFVYSYLKAAGVSTVNKELSNAIINATAIKYSEDRKTATATFDIPMNVLANDNQFNGTVEFAATDRAGNKTVTHKETKRIVVDSIDPTAQVSYNDPTNVVGDISYYNGNINATVTINEANFYANDVQVMVSKDGGAATAVTPTWTDNNVDEHVGTFTLTEDGDYIITINYSDKSSNPMTTYTSNQLTIDTDIQAPTFSINGVAKTEDGGAYKGDATIAFSYEDQNFDTKTIKLTRTRYDVVEDVTDEFITVNDNDKGGSSSFNIPSEVGNDGVYVLTIGMTDKANHSTESSIKFSINRFGSVYVYNDYLVSLIKDGGQYITIKGDNEVAITDDIIITEYNADRLLEGSLKIIITRDGETIDVDYTSNPSVINSSASIGDSGWFEYIYTIKASNFAEDGVYKITLASEYSASDSEKNESTSVPDNSIDESGEKILDSMSFVVDTTAPEIRNIVNLEEAIVNAHTLDVKYTIVDIGGLKSIEIIVDGETLETITDFGDSVFNYSGQFTLNESKNPYSVQIRVTDLAGNVTDTSAENFSTGDLYVFNDHVTVSTNFFVRWYANTPLFWGSIGGVVVLVAGIAFFIAYKMKKKDEENK